MLQGGQQILTENGAEPGVFAPGIRHQRNYYLELLAEGEGFEPSVVFTDYDGLANRWIKPLSHPSAGGSDIILAGESF